MNYSNQSTLAPVLNGISFVQDNQSLFEQEGNSARLAFPNAAEGARQVGAGAARVRF